jgi:hypothetical protein
MSPLKLSDNPNNSPKCHEDIISKGDILYALIAYD